MSSYHVPLPLGCTRYSPRVSLAPRAGPEMTPRPGGGGTVLNSLGTYLPPLGWTVLSPSAPRSQGRLGVGHRETYPWMIFHFLFLIFVRGPEAPFCSEQGHPQMSLLHSSPLPGILGQAF